MSDSKRGRRLVDLLWCALAGTLTFIAFPTALAPDLSFWPTLWLSHVPLLWLLRDKAPRAAFWWGLLCGTIINAGGYYWLTELLVTFGKLPLPVAVVGWLLHAVYLGLIWGVWAWLINRIGNTTPVPIQWSAPIVMVALELAVPRLFPAYMGNSQYPFVIILQVADLFGIYAVTFLLYRVNAVAYLWLRARIEGRQRPKKAAWATAALLAAALIYGGVRMIQIDARVESAPKLSIGIVEADIGIFEKEPVEQQLNHLLVHQRMSAELEKQGAQLIVWAESSYRMGDLLNSLPRDVPAFPRSDVPLVGDFLADSRRDTPARDRLTPIRGFRTPLLFGGISQTDREKLRYDGDLPVVPYNSAWLLDAEGHIEGRYDKNYLLLFGEYVPLVQYFPWIYKHIPTLGSLEAGNELNALEADLWGLGPVRFGVIICYEGILPAFTRRLATERPHILINLTNDDWFGKTAERYLHFALTIPRAIENRLAFARATLTGVSAFVDPVGRVVKATRPKGAETLLWAAPLLQSTTVYQVIGDAFAYGCLLLTLLFYLWGRWRRRG